MNHLVSFGSCLCVSERCCGWAPRNGGLRARWRTTHKVGEVGSPPSSQNAKGRRLLGAHSRHLRGPIKASHWWWEWAPGGCLSLAILSAFWAPSPATRRGRSWPLAGGGNGRPGGAFPLPFRAPFGRPFPPPAGGEQGPPLVVGMGAWGAPSPCRFKRLLGAQSRHLRGPIKTSRGWREWGPKRRLPFVFWALGGLPTSPYLVCRSPPCS